MKELIRKSKGITLVSLVVTIIIMLILAGISISELSGQGLFAKAIAAKEKTKIAELEEILKTKLYASTIENNGTIDVEKYIDYLENDDEYKDIAIEKENEVEYYVTMEEGYIFLVEEIEEGKINIVYSGKAGSLLPRIKEIKVINKTTNSIKVEVNSRFSNGATYKYYIKGQDEEYGNAKAEIPDTVYEFTELTQNEKYNIKVEIITKEGKTEKEIEVSLGAIKEVELGSFSPATWTNGDVTVTLPIEEGFTTRYTTDGTVPTTSSTQYTAPFTVSSNKIIMYCYSDGTNVSNYGVLEVNSIDKNQTTINTTLNASEKTTNSMTMNFNVIDEDSGISKITWYYKLEAETQFISESEINENAPINGDKTGITTEQNKTKTYSDLISGKYNVYVEIYDVAGNITRMPETGTVDVTLEPIENASGATISPSTWTNGNVTVTLPTKTGYTTRYTTDGSVPTRSSTQYTTPFIVSSNQTINYCYSDGINVGQYGTQEVNNIDKTKPIVTVATATTNSIAITATDEKSGIVGYAVTTSNTEPSASSYTAVTSTTSLSTTVTRKTQNTTYYVWVKDQAGNVSESKSTTTGTVTSGTTTGAITFGTTTWSGGKASTTISTNTSYTIQYQVNSITGTWKTGTSVTGLVHGDNVYARLWDGTNAGTASAAYNILDGTNPSASITLSATNVTTTGSITATVTHTDNQSGVKIASCKWVYNTTASAIGTNASSYTGGTFSSNPQTITLSSTTAGTYYLHVLTTDVAGRTKETISSPVTVIVSKLANEVSVGDYVAYNATNSYSYTSPLENNGSSAQTFTSSSSIKWRVLSTNTSPGEVVLISEAPIGRFTMYGGTGYNNAERELDNICKIYGYGTGADTSKNFTYVSGSGARSTNLDDLESNNSESRYQVLFKNITNTDYLEYWLANKYSRYYSDAGGQYTQYFMMRVINGVASGEMMNVGGSYDTGSESGTINDNFSNTFGIRPIVYLKTTVKTSGKDASGAWTIIDN